MTIQLAIISGLPNLERLSTLGDIEMSLTHLILKNPTYAAYYRRQSDRGRFVILDNSAFELEHLTGRGMSTSYVLEAAEKVNPSEIICRDILYDGPATIEATRQFVVGVRSWLEGRGLSLEASPVKLMAVPQGGTVLEWLWCYEVFESMPEISTIGLSKLSIPRSWHLPLMEARLMCVETIHDGGTKPLHLLGGGPNLGAELRLQKEYPRVRSNDSSFAFWYAAKEVVVDVVAGKATSELLDKPNLETLELEGDTLSQAVGLVQFLKECAS